MLQRLSSRLMVIYLVAALLPEATWEVTRKRNNIPSGLRQNYFVTPAYHLLIVFFLARDEEKIASIAHLWSYVRRC